MADTPVGTAFIEVRPDLTGFEAELSAKLRTAVRNLAVPTAGLAKGATAQTALGTATRRTTKALGEQATVMQFESTQLARFSRGIAATSLAQFGLRGATLASTSAFLAGAAAITTLSKALGVATSFNSQLAVFQATTGATGAELERVSRVAKELGASLALPGVTATDAAVSMTELAKAGLSVEDAIDGAQGVLQLAKAANIDFAQATELAAAALNTFHLAGREASHVADVFANAANAAQGSIVDMGVAFQQAGAVAHLAGFTFEDTAVFITQLARSGLSSSDAGTSLRTALIRLINPTKKAQELFRQLHLTLRDVNGNIRPDFFVELGAAIEGLDKKHRDLALAQIGGQDAIRALTILSKGGIKQFLATREELEKQGTAANVAKARLTGLAGAQANLSNTVERFALTLGQKATPSIIAATNAITQFILEAAKSPLIGVVGDTLHTTAQIIGQLADALRAVSPLITTVIGAFSGVVGALGVPSILAAVVAYKALGSAIKKVTEARAVSNIFAGFAGTNTVTGNVKSLGLTVATAFSSFRNFGLGLRAIGLNLIGLATSAFSAQLAITALVTAVVFLETRESSSERQTRHLSEATRDLAAAFDEASANATALGSAQDALNQNKLQQTTARLAVEDAKRDLANSNAAKGSLERRKLIFALLVAQQNLKFANKDLARSEKDVGKAAAANKQSIANRIAALKVERDEILKTIQVESKQALLRVPGAEIPGLKVKRDSFTAEQNLIKAIEGRRQTELKANTEGSRDAAARLGALEHFVSITKNLKPVVGLLFNAKTATAGLKQVEALFHNTGNKVGENLAKVLAEALKPKPGVFDPLVEEAAKAGRDAGAAIAVNLAGTLRGMLGQAAGFGRAALLADVAGNVRAQLAFLTKEEEKLTAALHAAVTGGKAGPATIEKIAGQLKQVQDARQSILDQQANARKQAKQAAEAAAQQADQDFLTAQTEAQGPFDIAIATAGLTKSLVDNIAAQKNLSAFIKQEIAQANSTIRDIHLRIQTVTQLRLALIASRASTQQLIEEQKANARQRIIDKRDRQEESLELDVQIANTQKNKAKELAAHRALLHFLQERIKHTSAGTVERRRLQLKIEQEKAAINDLTKANDAKGDALAALELSFLQTQSGFAANLLGNLLPLGSIAGVVGGGALPTPTTPLGGGSVTPAGGPPLTLGGKAIDTSIAKEAQKATTPGPSHGQLSTLITIARAQLQLLQRATKTTPKSGHPEATVQRAAQQAAMDTLPW